MRRKSNLLQNNVNYYFLACLKSLLVNIFDFMQLQLFFLLKSLLNESDELGLILMSWSPFKLQSILVKHDCFLLINITMLNKGGL